ncbi:hypothetical protein [Microcoleus sp. T2B6]
MPVPQRGNFLVRFVENATRYQFNRTLNLRLRLWEIRSAQM